jgi:hypothetical protein
MRLKAPKNRVVIKVDLESKNTHKFADGTTIRLERQFDNFNMRYVKPTNAIVVSANNIPEGAEILIHHNSTHDVYRIFNYLPPTTDASSNVKYYSIPEEECFFWREKEGDEWKPMPNFVTALRLFKPYVGTFEGVPHTLLKDRLLITSGELKGKAVITLKSSDYEIIYQNENGTEDRVIRVRYYNEWNERNEIITIDDNLTEMIDNGEVLVGLSSSDAKTLN